MKELFLELIMAQKIHPFYVTQVNQSIKVLMNEPRYYNL